MPDVTIYTTRLCPYCAMAKALLRKKNVAFEEIDVAASSERQKMTARAGGRRTVPQIFLGENHIGGCDDLHDLEAEGKLDRLLVAA
jgi:glutaredoxin 3